jgi:hypothetical protein
VIVGMPSGKLLMLFWWEDDEAIPGLNVSSDDETSYKLLAHENWS